MPLRDAMFDATTSTGLSARTSALLAYSGWWVTGLTIWWLERRDRTARYHAAQSVVLFGGLALLVTVFGVAAAAALSFAPAAFRFLVGAAALCAAVGLLLWVALLWRTWRGDDWRVIGVRAVAARLVGDRV